MKNKKKKIGMKVGRGYAGGYRYNKGNLHLDILFHFIKLNKNKVNYHRNKCNCLCLYHVVIFNRNQAKFIIKVKSVSH